MDKISDSRNTNSTKTARKFLATMNGVRSFMVLLLSLMVLHACNKPEEPQYWAIGGKKPKQTTILDSDSPKRIEICPTERGGSGYPMTLVVKHDDEKTVGLHVGQCKTFEARKVEITFATLSSFKFAIGTYKISDLP